MLHRTPDKLPRTFLLLATLVTNTLIALLLVNVGLAGFFYFRYLPPVKQDQTKAVVRSDTALFNTDGSPVDNGRRSIYQLQWFDFNAYENIDPNYASDVLDGFAQLGKLGFKYQPWVGFLEPAFNSKLVNVDTDAHGTTLRRTVNPANDQNLPTVSIVVMGGSPTFAYNVSDDHTWASQLSKILNQKAEADRVGIHVEVLNYGKGYYYPSQETALLIDMLKRGQRPNLVIFLDGVNLGPIEDVPMYTEEMTRLMTNMQFEPPFTERFSWIPMVRLADAFRTRFSSGGKPSLQKQAPDLAQQVDTLVNTFDQNMEISTAVARIYGVDTLYFLQPNVMYHYSTELFRRPVRESFRQDQKLIMPLYEKLKQEPRRIDLSLLFEKWGATKKAIVDDVHYSPGFNKLLAEEIANRIDLKALARGPNTIKYSASR